MACSKKDYERAAQLVQEYYRDNSVFGGASGAHIEEAFVEFFLVNPRFDVQRFRRACVPGANVRARS